MTYHENNEDFSLKNLTSYLNKKNIIIKEIYSEKNFLNRQDFEDEMCSFIKVVYSDTGKTFIVSIPSKYKMKVDYKDHIKLVKFIDVDDDMITLVLSKKDNYNYDQIKNSDLEDELYLDPRDADKLMEQYEAIDIDSERRNILKFNITSYKRQLDRFKICVSNIKYKLCISTESSLCYINNLNNVECYAVEQCISEKKEHKDLYIVIDLENFYNKLKTNSIEKDIDDIYKSLFDILNKSYNIQKNIISTRLRKFNNLPSLLDALHDKKNNYEKTIRDLTDILENIKTREEKGNSNINKQPFINESSNIPKTLQQFKDEAREALNNVKSDYNSFILGFENVIFNSTKLFNQILENFTEIGLFK